MKSEKKAKHRSLCPTNLAVEVLGDKWTLLIIRDIIIDDKHHFREFLKSEEKIASNILTTRLGMLEAEKRLTSRVGPLPDTYSFSRQGFVSESPNLDAILFGASEYAKDGLLAVTELLGPGPWSDRMDAPSTCR